jgi:hypothetical protein
MRELSAPHPKLSQTHSGDCVHGVSPVPGAHDVAELIHTVRAADHDGVAEMRRLFYPGARFLIERQSDVPFLRRLLTARQLRWPN